MNNNDEEDGFFVFIGTLVLIIIWILAMVWATKVFGIVGFIASFVLGFIVVRFLLLVLFSVCINLGILLFDFWNLIKKIFSIFGL